MPLGTIKKLVHLSSQSSRLANAALVPTRTTVGYGLLEAEGQEWYFDADAVECRFEEIAVGDAVEFDLDLQFAVATRVRPQAGERSALDPAGTNGPARGATASGVIAAWGTSVAGSAAAAAPVAAGGNKPASPRPKKPAAEDGEFRLATKSHCLFVARYERCAPGQWRRVGTLPQIETYASDISEKYREPQLALVTPSRAVVRLYDEQAVNLKRVTDFLGDFSRAQARADQCLLERFPSERVAAEQTHAPTW